MLSLTCAGIPRKSQPSPTKLPCNRQRRVCRREKVELTPDRSDKRMTPKAVIGRVAAILAALIAIESSALAQYDRNGRYVPSPMGVPQDPYARPIPMYPGTPGGAVGTPITRLASIARLHSKYARSAAFAWLQSHLQR